MTGAKSKFRRQLRQTLTIARRDFIATVFTPIFLLFLFAPAFMGAFGAIGGLGAASVSSGSAAKERLIVIARPEDAAAIKRADATLATRCRPCSRPAAPNAIRRSRPVWRSTQRVSMLPR